MMQTAELYDSPAVQCPSVEELAILADEMHLKCSTQDIETIHEKFKEVASAIQVVSRLQQPSLPVKYPRTPGHKPAKRDNPFNAWCYKCDIKGADVGKLAGKTFGIKDNVAVAGVPLMNGTRLLEGYTPEFDATVVTRILDAGGHILGKTNCEHFCFSGSSFTGDGGAVRNPHDETRSTGGSSTGSGALVSSGKVDMAIGGDQGGSIRIPSSWCGIVGLKPTHGLVPYTGAMSIEVTVDHLGPMTKTVADCALLLEVIAGHDEGRDPRQYPMKIPEYSKLIDSGISGKRIGLVKEGFENCTESDVAELVKREATRLTEAGAIVEEISIPEHKEGQAIWMVSCLPGTYNCMVKNNGAGMHWKGFYPMSMIDATRRGLATQPQDLSGIMKHVCLVSEYLEQHYQNRFYAMAQNLTITLTKTYNDWLDKFDVLVMPTLPFKATKLPLAGTELKEHLEVGIGMVCNTCPFNSTGHPALSINAGFSQGLPVGMQIIGRHFDEETVLQVARAFEVLRDGK